MTTDTTVHESARAASRDGIDLDGSVFQWPDTPGFRAAYAEAKARSERQVDRLCPFGNCTTWIDPLDGTVIGGVGPVGCGCDSLPGWRSKYYDGLPKPGWPVKPVGRHGGRIAASRRKAKAHARWLADLDAIIDAPA